tara:strand:+ start:263 stop:1624 length:1362 start_codon:yes stop_codon:yes gene_type:complete
MEEEFVPSIDDVLGTGVGSDHEDYSSQNNKPDADKNKDGEGGKPKPDTPKPTPKPNEGGDNNNSGEEEEDDSNLSSEDKIVNLLKSYNNVDGLNDAQKGVRQRLLNSYKGESFDESGNIIDADGQVIKTAAEIYEKLQAPEEAPTVDANGNQIDEEGNIIKTRLELAADKSVVNKMHLNSEYEFVDDKGAVKIYEDSDEGVNEFANDIANIRLQEFKETFFGQHPVLREVSKHLLTGGTLENFGNLVDYSKIKTEDLSKEDKLSYIRESFEKRGLSKERVADNLQRIKDGNAVDKEFDYALEDLKAIQKTEQEARDAKVKQMTEQRARDNEEQWRKIEDTIKKGKINQVSIDAKDQEGFLDYISKPINSKGQSQADLDRGKEDLEAKLLFDFFRYKGYDFETFINNRVGSKRVESLREQLLRSAKIKEEDFKQTNVSKGNSEPSAVSIEEMLG